MCTKTLTNLIKVLCISFYLFIVIPYCYTMPITAQLIDYT